VLIAQISNVRHLAASYLHRQSSERVICKLLRFGLRSHQTRDHANRLGVHVSQSVLQNSILRGGAALHERSQLLRMATTPKLTDGEIRHYFLGKLAHLVAVCLLVPRRPPHRVVESLQARVQQRTRGFEIRVYVSIQSVRDGLDADLFLSFYVVVRAHGWEHLHL